jgi:hypothetical protein
MSIRMKVLFCILATFSLWAQDAAQAPARQPLGRVIGEVTAKDSGKLTVKSDTGGSYTVTIEGTTSFVRVPPGEKDLKKATKITAGDVNVGDRVMARGQVSEEQKSVPAVQVIVMSKTDLEEKQQRERAEWQQRGASGKITAVHPESNEITIASRVGGALQPVTLEVAKNTTFRRYAPDSVRFADAKPSSITDLKPGDQLRVLGNKTDDGTKIKAEEIVSGTFRAIPATVVSVDAASGEVKVTDLDTKKPLVVVATSDTQVKKLPEMAARMMANMVNGGAGGSGGPGGPGAAGMRPRGPGGPGGARPEGAQRGPGGTAGPGGPSGPGGAGGPGGMRGGMRSGDLSQMLERLPAYNISELKPGDALIISSTAGANTGRVSAITILAGVEPILTSAPRSAGQINLGNWSMDINMPQ